MCITEIPIRSTGKADIAISGIFLHAQGWELSRLTRRNSASPQLSVTSEFRADIVTGRTPASVPAHCEQSGRRKEPQAPLAEWQQTNIYI